MAGHDVFMVFVDGKPGHEEEYARWFLGQHMADMASLSGVSSLFAGRLTSLDCAPPPARLCALYHTPNGSELLGTIASSKGTTALPVSDLQGAMVWRMLEPMHSVFADELARAPDAVLICMSPNEIDNSVLYGLQGDYDSVSSVRHMRISPIQPARGREFAEFLLIGLEPDANPAKVAASLRDRQDSEGMRCLLVSAG